MFLRIGSELNLERGCVAIAAPPFRSQGAFKSLSSSLCDGDLRRGDVVLPLETDRRSRRNIQIHVIFALFSCRNCAARFGLSRHLTGSATSANSDHLFFRLHPLEALEHRLAEDFFFLSQFCFASTAGQRATIPSLIGLNSHVPPVYVSRSFKVCHLH